MLMDRGIKAAELVKNSCAFLNDVAIIHRMGSSTIKTMRIIKRCAITLARLKFSRADSGRVLMLSVGMEPADIDVSPFPNQPVEAKVATVGAVPPCQPFWG